MKLGLLRGTSGRRRRVTTAQLFEVELLNGLPLAWRHYVSVLDGKSFGEP
jgi:hypothetical protein